MAGQLELVLQACELRARQRQDPAAVFTAKLALAQRQIRAEPDRRVALLGVIDA
jgi:hypothetical protein